MDTKVKPRYELRFSRLKWSKIGAVVAITSYALKNSKNDVFTRKQTGNKGPPKEFRSFEVRE